MSKAVNDYCLSKGSGKGVAGAGAVCCEAHRAAGGTQESNAMGMREGTILSSSKIKMPGVACPVQIPGCLLRIHRLGPG